MIQTAVAYDNREDVYKRAILKIWIIPMPTDVGEL